MKICAAQTKPVKGNIQANIEKHLQLIDLSIAEGSDVIIFPELSITGYEPLLANDLATTISDIRFEPFQEISNRSSVIIGIGVPLKNETGISISMLLFQPKANREVYAKKYLHADEDPFFVSGQSTIYSIGKSPNIALSICYELSVPEHAEKVFRNNPNIYFSSVAKSVRGIDKALERLSQIASTYAVPVIMSNCIGVNDGEACAGKSVVFNKEGKLLHQLDDSHEGILIYDTTTEETTAKIM